jgi:Membrane dipeptidase (Peptidase family M19).
MVVDSHCDAPCDLLRGADFSGRVPFGFTPGKFPLAQVDFPRMKKGGVDASFFAIYTSNSLSPDEATHRALDMPERERLGKTTGHRRPDEDSRQADVSSTFL